MQIHWSYQTIPLPVYIEEQWSHSDEHLSASMLSFHMFTVKV